ncbi:unnamed protein product [Bursaphelenchus xylophilus]|uniref:Aspartate dehydrogenase domain-containing protein n=1 Tax=Bursaphelenchus xylophilus TaxID=6326 RepID=A0A1I7RUW5_BURXY|nr:unnamed protein product [Bursaphelenchus xylophilus]CAG9105362.1 unnamed protein product [Bursaphelenchus xylophilus]
MADRKPKRVGIIGYGHIGQFLKIELAKRKEFVVQRIWNRTEDEKENVLPLTELTAERLEDIDLVIEVAHPTIVENYGGLILRHADFFIGSPTALADKTLFDTLQGLLKVHPDRAVFVPSGAFWGSNDVKKMADLGTLKELQITMIKHPDSFKVLGKLNELNNHAKESNSPMVLYEGPVRLLCPLAPNNVNTMAGAAIAAHNLGFDRTMAKLIADPALRDWHIVEYELKGENGFCTKLRRENPAKRGAVTGDFTYFSFLSSVIETLYKPPGFNIC